MSRSATETLCGTPVPINTIHRVSEENSVTLVDPPPTTTEPCVSQAISRESSRIDPFDIATITAPVPI